MADVTQRPNVVKFLPHWETFLKAHGPERTKKHLVTGRYRGISKKDAYWILVALGLSR